MENMTIDKNLLMTPCRSKAKTKEMIYTDHYAILLSFKNIPLKDFSMSKNGIRMTIWNTNKRTVGKGTRRKLKITECLKILIMRMKIQIPL